MFVSRYSSIGLLFLLSLNVLCHAQLKNDKVAYPESEEEDPAKQNSQVKWRKCSLILQHFFAYFQLILFGRTCEKIRLKCTIKTLLLE